MNKKSMKWKITVIILFCIFLIMIIGYYKFRQFEDVRLDVKNNTDAPIFKDSMMLTPRMYPNLQEIIIGEEDNVSEIKNLSMLDNLIELSIFDNPNVTKIEGLEKQNKLEILLLINDGITKIEGLKNLNHIREINLSVNQITKIENIEAIPLVENDYCYILADSQSYKKFGQEMINDSGGYENVCFVDEKPSEYYSRELYNDNYKYNQMVSPLKSLRLEDNPITSISKASYDYIKKYDITVYLEDYTSDKTIDDLKIA